MKNSKVTPRMMTREQASAYTGLEVRQLQRREQAGLLRRLKPVIKPGHMNGATYYLTEDLDRLIEDAIEAGKRSGVRPPRARRTDRRAG